MALSRRSLLKGALLGAPLLGFSQLFGYTRLFAQADGDSPEVILNLAATAEALACTHYYTVLTDSSVPLVPAERYFLIAALDTEYQHLQFLRANGAEPLTLEFYMPRNVYNDRANFSNITQQAETAFVAAYLAANRRFAELGESLLAATIAQIAATESVHLALVRQLGGLLPNHVSLGEALYFNTYEVVPVLQPFLEGGEGFTGPRSYPGDREISTFVGTDAVVVVPPFTELGIEE